MTTPRDLVIYAGQTFTLSLPYAGTAGRGQRLHIRWDDGTATVVQILTHNGATNARVIYDGTDSLDITIGASVSALWLVGDNRVEWAYDLEDYDLSDADDVIITHRGKVIVYGNRTRSEDVTPSDQMPSGDGRYVRFDGAQDLTVEQQNQVKDNLDITPGGGSGDVVGPASATDSRIAEFDGVTGKLLKQSSYTITSLLAAAWARASHTGTQIAATISDFASAAVAAVTWSTLTGKPSTFAPSAHKTSHATGGGDALTASDIGAQPLATVLTNTTASFTAAQETKLSGIEASADVTDAGNVGAAIDGATAKTTPVDADTVPLIDSAASSVLKKLSWANIKATAKAYFDTIYQAILVSGTNIKTINSTSLLGSGDIAVSASPGGSSGQPQVNIAGAFAGMAGWDYDNTNRSLTVTGATVTASRPLLDMSQTWNNAAVAFTAEKTNVTNTASAAGSLLRDWQVGGVSQLNIGRAGLLNNRGVTFGKATTADGFAVTAGSYTTVIGGYYTILPGYGFIGWASNGTNGDISYPDDLALCRDAASVLAQRWGNLAMTSRIYGAYSDLSNYVRASLAATSTTVTLAAETAGTGADNVPLNLNATGTSSVAIGNPLGLKSYTVATVPSASASGPGATIYVSDETGGAVLAFSDATNWRRVTDRAVIS